VDSPQEHGFAVNSVQLFLQLLSTPLQRHLLLQHGLLPRFLLSALCFLALALCFLALALVLLPTRLGSAGEFLRRQQLLRVVGPLLGLQQS
jgi:hypothetical protein